MRKIAKAVAVQVIALIAIPVIIDEATYCPSGIRGDVKGVVKEVVTCNEVVLGVCHDLHRPTVICKRIGLDQHSIGAFD